MAKPLKQLSQEVVDALQHAGREFSDALAAQGRRQRKRLDEIVLGTREQLDRMDLDLNLSEMDDEMLDRFRAAGFDGDITSPQYRDLFLDNFPDSSPGNVHHAIEQGVLGKEPWAGLFDSSEIHSLLNLRGVPAEINNPVHLSAIRQMWNQFYAVNAPDVGTVPDSVMRDRFTDFATLIDDAFGDLFDPPVR